MKTTSYARHLEAKPASPEAGVSTAQTVSIVVAVLVNVFLMINLWVKY